MSVSQQPVSGKPVKMPGDEHRVRVSGDLTVRYRQVGQGSRPIIFVPGWGTSLEVYVHQLRHFEKSADFLAIAYDPRGQGGSSKTTEGNTYQQHGRDLANLLKVLKLRDVMLAGWSFGIYAVYAYLDEFGKENVSGLISIDSSPQATGHDNTKEWVWYRYDDADRVCRWFTDGSLGDRRSFGREFAEWMLESPDQESIDWIQEMLDQMPGYVGALLNETGAYLDYSKLVRRLSNELPMQFFIREEWRSLAGEWISKHAPGCSLAVMGKHLMFWERPGEFNSELDKFLAQITDV